MDALPSEPDLATLFTYSYAFSLQARKEEAAL
jgi:hypothetical protein